MNNEFTKELDKATLIAFWSSRAKTEPLGYIGFVASDHRGCSAKAIAQIDRWRAKGQQANADRIQAKQNSIKLAVIKTALHLTDHPAFKWRVVYGVISKTYFRRNNVAAKTAGIIAHDRLLTREFPILPSHYVAS